MRKNKALFALLTGVLAATLFALPAPALAATIITQADVDAKGGTYTIDSPGDYTLGEDITGLIKFAPTYSVHKTSEGFEVVNGTDLPKDACWKVTYNSTPVYFDTTAEKDEFVTKYSIPSTAVEQVRWFVTFEPANGDDAVTRVVNPNGTAEGQVENPVKADGVFKYWSEDGKTDFDIEHTAITKDTKLTAVYDSAVATNGVEGYSSLQTAISDNCHEVCTIKLLQDTTENVTVPEGADLTIDLNGHTLTASGSKAALGVAGKAKLVIESNAKGGKIVSSTTGINISDAAAGSNVTLKGDVTVQTTSANAADAAVSVNGASTLVIGGGVYSARATGKAGKAFALIACGGATVSVTDGSFESDSDCTIKVADATTKADFACDISGHIDLKNTGAEDENVVIHAGTLGDATNAENVESGKYLYKGNEEDAYKVITLEDDEYVYDSMFVVYNDGVSTKVYFKTYEAAEAYAGDLEYETGEDSYVINLYRATLVADGETIDVRVREDGEELGDLPDGSEYQIDDYTFAGWYVDGKKVDSSYEVLKDIDVVAMWYWNGSSNENPTPNPSKKENKHLPQTGDPALAVSGIAAAGAALAGIGALRRRK